jgi:hypothetical protein
MLALAALALAAAAIHLPVCGIAPAAIPMLLLF